MQLFLFSFFLRDQTQVILAPTITETIKCSTPKCAQSDAINSVYPNDQDKADDVCYPVM
jgi:hypothetical protein